MTDTHLAILSYLILMSLFGIYAVLDGFDLGVGIIYLFFSDPSDRLTLQKIIGPVWNGNEVWLLVAGGGLFAAFPSVYATVLSALYLPVILLLAGFIVRAIALEVRSSLPILWWNRWWDGVFSISSMLIVFLLGVTVGNLLQGLYLDDNQEYAGRFLDLVSPYPLLVGVTSMLLFALHGALYGLLKTEKTLHVALKRYSSHLLAFFIGSYALTLASSFFFFPHIASNFAQRPLVWAGGAINLMSISTMIFCVLKGISGTVVFGASCCTVFSTLALYAGVMFPTLVHASYLPEQLSLTVFNAASSSLSLQIFFLYIGIGIPCVLLYSFYVYRAFAGDNALDDETYTQ